jgi:phospholipid/cholesterol/gamma-HCH transport system ATP-binding protein
LTPQTATQPVTTDAKPTAAAGEPIVRLVDVYKSFGSLKVLDGVSIDFEKGKNTVIVGPSGTGKSVLLKHIVGLLRPDKGEVYFDKQRTDELGEPELVAVRKRIGFLFQMGALFDSMSVGDNVEFPLVEHAKMTPADRHERRDAVLKMVGLPGIAKKMPAELSGGQRKRVALARAVVLNPDVVLYDEPTTGLDPIRSDVINELIVQLNRKLGITSIIVTHDMISARKIAHRIVMLYDGHIVADQPPEEFLSSQDDLVKRFVQGIADKEDLQSIQDGFD